MSIKTTMSASWQARHHRSDRQLSHWQPPVETAMTNLSRISCRWWWTYTKIFQVRRAHTEKEELVVVTPGSSPYTHFTKGLWAHNSNLAKIHIALTSVYIKNYDEIGSQILHMPRQLSCHGMCKIWDPISSFELKLKQNEFHYFFTTNS